VILRQSAELPIIEISGNFSDALVEDLRVAYQEACRCHSQVILKFDEGGRIYSSGIAVLVGLIKEAEEQGQKIHATGLSAHFISVFKLTGLTKYIQIFPSEQEALAASAGSQSGVES